MIVTKAGIEQMVLTLTSAEGFGTGGHNDFENRASQLVPRLAALVKEMPNSLCIPDALVEFLDGSIMGDVVAGYGRPLGYLCSDCRYPKWCMTPQEVLKVYPHIDDYVERANNPKPNGFTSVTPACPKCGD